MLEIRCYDIHDKLCRDQYHQIWWRFKVLCEFVVYFCCGLFSLLSVLFVHDISEEDFYRCSLKNSKFSWFCVCMSALSEWFKHCCQACADLIDIRKKVYHKCLLFWIRYGPIARPLIYVASADVYWVGCRCRRLFHLQKADWRFSRWERVSLGEARVANRFFKKMIVFLQRS